MTSIQYPGSFRIDARTPAGPLVQVFQNGDFWVSDARGTRDAPATRRRRDAQQTCSGTPIGLLLALLDHNGNRDARSPTCRSPDGRCPRSR